MAEYIDRPRVKAEAKELLRDAQVPYKAFFLIYLLLIQGMGILSDLATGNYGYQEIFSHPLGLFALILTTLLSLLLTAGTYLYCMAIRQGERPEYLTLFDGFSFAGKAILLYIVQYIFVFLWMLLFIVPGFIAAYRYRFALLNLYEDPSMEILDALNMSKQQTYGYKGQLFLLDLSYFGWYLLALLPSLIYSWYGTTLLLSSVSAGSSAAAAAAQFSSPLWLTILFGLWAVAVQLFYLPVYQTTELGYFAVAKRSSGVGANLTPPESGAHTPDTPS